VALHPARAARRDRAAAREQRAGRRPAGTSPRARQREFAAAPQPRAPGREPAATRGDRGAQRRARQRARRPSSQPWSAPRPRCMTAWPAPIADAALHGPAGEFVLRTEPHSEAHPVALLTQFLVAFGTACGRCAHYQVEADRHYSNEFVVLVGPTATGRKGSSWGHVRRLLGRPGTYQSEGDSLCDPTVPPPLPPVPSHGITRLEPARSGLTIPPFLSYVVSAFHQPAHRRRQRHVANNKPSTNNKKTTRNPR